MSMSFSSARPRNKGDVSQQAIQKMLDENHHLIQCIMDYQSKGKAAECTQYQQILHRNLVYLATIADSNQNMQSLLPAPPTSNISMGPGGMSGGHTQGNLNDNMGPGLTSTAMMQGQMSNGPSHDPMQHQFAQVHPTFPSASLNLPASSYNSLASASGYNPTVSSSQGNMSQGPGPGYGYASSSSSTPSSSSSSSCSNLNMQSSQVSLLHQQTTTPLYSSTASGSQHYQGQQTMGMMGQGSQGNSMMSQRPMGSYRSAQPGSAQQYMGQDEFYGEQYGHTQSSSEPINQQYYPDGHGEYSYQQSSYGEQGYEKSFDESPQHYYEGGNSQYSQQQSQFQQGSGQQPFSQQQFSSQQGYSGQPQGYGSGQSGSSQYSQYQQGQYGSYRSSQGGPGTQAQRPFHYEQGQYGNYQQ
uniref:calcium-responsive transactivator-like isoform X2 n=1 Tax=Doryrhamphus excisus TaxID=161450 RepID=UPI0025ADAE89|nr:calcium-responsive transactivator-like isoform X2 [Doryrhamphus excisus]